MLLYILNSEVENCFRAAQSEDNTIALDVASLYLTTQEVGLDEAADYFIHYGGTVGQGLTSFFSGQEYPTKEEFKKWLSAQRDDINSIRSELGLNESHGITEAELNAALDDLWDLFISEGAGDSLELP